MSRRTVGMGLGLGLGLIVFGAGLSVAIHPAPSGDWRVAAVARAETPAPDVQRFRGSIASFSDHILTIQGPDGGAVALGVAPNASIETVRKISLDDIHPGSYVGTAIATGANGEARALEVVVFPEPASPLVNGLQSWDVRPDNKIVSGTVKAVVTSSGGPTMTVMYDDKEYMVILPPDTVVVTLDPATADDLKTGAHVVTVARRAVDGKVVAADIILGKDGVNPPM